MCDHLPFEERVELSHSRLINTDLLLLVVAVLPPHVLRPRHWRNQLILIVSTIGVVIVIMMNILNLINTFVRHQDYSARPHQQHNHHHLVISSPFPPQYIMGPSLPMATSKAADPPVLNAFTNWPDFLTIMTVKCEVPRYRVFFLTGTPQKSYKSKKG